jgi:hypothetical protein
MLDTKSCADRLTMKSEEALNLPCVPARVSFNGPAQHHAYRKLIDVDCKSSLKARRSLPIFH